MNTLCKIFHFNCLFLCVLLVACGGGGGGGGSGGDSKVATSITVIDGYIKGATVCVDKNDNGACEADETQGTTDENGKVTLNIPAADVGKYHIVAYVPAGAIDSDTGKAVGTAFTLRAPKDENSVVTPLTTLVVQKIEGDSTGKTTTARAKQQVSDSTGINLSYLMGDVTQNIDQTPRTLARLLAAIQKNRLSDLDAVSSCKASYKNDVIQAALDKNMSSIKTSKEISACSPADAQKTDACAQAINSKAKDIVAATDSLSTKTLLQSLASNNCSANLLPTTTISGASSGGKDINSGDRTDSLAVTLKGG